MATINKAQCYNGQSNLKASGVQISYTADQVDEWIKCSKDPIYFIKKYVKVIHVDRGTVPFELYPFQEDIIKTYHENRKAVVLTARQMGKTITTAAYFLWVILFNSDKNIAILANKAAMAREILSRIQFSYENLPFWIQQGVVEWNKGSIKLDNNSKIFTAATSPNAIRGQSCTHVYVDEIAFIPNNIAEEFMTSVFPVLSSGENTKIFISSTPKGMNMFYKIWVEANTGRNGFVPLKIEWSAHPSRNQAWYDEQTKNLGPVKAAQEIDCVGPDTLITIRNKLTKIIETIAISTLQERLNKI